jgi:hypothetical protein
VPPLAPTGDAFAAAADPSGNLLDETAAADDAVPADERAVAAAERAAVDVAAELDPELLEQADIPTVTVAMVATTADRKTRCIEAPHTCAASDPLTGCVE